MKRGSAAGNKEGTVLWDDAKNRNGQKLLVLCAVNEMVCSPEYHLPN